VCRNECTKNPDMKHMYIILTQYYSFLYSYLHIFQLMHKLDLHTVNFIKQFLNNYITVMQSTTYVWKTRVQALKHDPLSLLVYAKRFLHNAM
jgi:hypothetical protein